MRADLGLMSEEPNEKVKNTLRNLFERLEASDFELVSKAMEKSLALEKAKAEIAELESPRPQRLSRHR